jgi:methylase of polypeptide subunit release factors
MSSLEEKQGSIYTPEEYANLLASWAITKKTDNILDVGVGEGSITFAAFRRLLDIGASKDCAQNQIYGSEIDLPTFKKFTEIASNNNCLFPNIKPINFFESVFPNISVVIGNPPFVKRSKIANFDVVKSSTLLEDDVFNTSISGLSDLYIYFLLKASSKLKPGGKLAVITSDSWLNARYGKHFKYYLQQNFEIEHLVSFDRNIFNADVRGVITFATKRLKATSNSRTHFVRVRNGLPAEDVLKVLSDPSFKLKDVDVTSVKSSELSSEEMWGIKFKSPEIYKKIQENENLVPVNQIAKTRIGLQTLAKDFFVLSANEAENLKIEEKFLTKLVQSSRYQKETVIKKDDIPSFYLFYCNEPKSQLVNTEAIKYIESAEEKTVSVRGKNETVIGYQNKDRIKKARRLNWYDLKTDLERRGRAEILIPRLVSRSFNVVWNQGNFVPGEFYIEFLPNKQTPNVKIETYLAYLSSSLFEFSVRTKAQLYGGGAYNLNPGQIKGIPCLNFVLLSTEQKTQLEIAYKNFIKDKTTRSRIDSLVFDIVGIDETLRLQINKALEDLTEMVNRSKKHHNVS